MDTIATQRGTIAGGISVLMIFLTLCIAIYGLLSLLTAENELSLNMKNREAATDYYAADALAASIISDLASAIARGEAIASEARTLPIVYDSETGTASFIVPIDRYRDLDVSISLPLTVIAPVTTSDTTSITTSITTSTTNSTTIVMTPTTVPVTTPATIPSNGGHIVIDRYCVVSNLDWQDQARGKLTVITGFE